jgi:uncharacterized membrane protein (UPF0136 family)
MTPANIVLWVYIVLLVVGGIIGFAKAGSKISLIMAIVFAIPLAIFAAGKIHFPFFADILLNGLLLFFLARYGRNRKFMPSGMMSLATAAALIAHLILNHHAA